MHKKNIFPLILLIATVVLTGVIIVNNILSSQNQTRTMQSKASNDIISNALYIPLYTKNLGATGTKTQSTYVVLSNTTPNDASATISMYTSTGTLIKPPFTKIVPKGGIWNSYGDGDFTAPDGTKGWVKIISSGAPLMGSVRTIFLNNGVFSSVTEYPLISRTSKNLYMNSLFRNHPTGGTEVQSNYLILVNPTLNDTRVSVNIHSSTGAVIHSIPVSIPANSLWDSYNNGEWKTMPVNVNGKVGWVDIESLDNVAIVGMTRLVTNPDGIHNIIYDNSLTTEATNNLYVPMYRRNWPSGSSPTNQFTDVYINNPSTTPVTITVKIYDYIGSPLKDPFTVTISGGGIWDSYADPLWEDTRATLLNNVSNGTFGTAIISSSTTPIIGSLRLRNLFGTQWYSPFVSMQDMPLYGFSGGVQYAPLVLQAWSAGFSSGLYQHSDIIIQNISGSNTTLDIKFNRIQNGIIGTGTMSKPITAYGMYDSHGDPDWIRINQMFAADVRGPIPSSVGWVSITASNNAQIVGYNVLSLKNGVDYTSALRSITYSSLVADLPSFGEPMPNPTLTVAPVPNIPISPVPNTPQPPTSIPVPPSEDPFCISYPILCVTPQPPTSTPPTSTPVATVTLAPNAVAINMKIKLQDINSNQNLRLTTIPVKVQVRNTAILSAVQTVNFTVSSGGVWNGRAIMNDVPQGSNYAVSITGPYNLTKVICDSIPRDPANNLSVEPKIYGAGKYVCETQAITLNSGENTLDFTGTTILSCDLPIHNNTKDGVCDISDLVYLRRNAFSTDPNVIAIGDINLDGRVNSLDRSTMLYAFEVKTGERL